MKIILTSLALCLCACKTPEQNARLGSLVSLAVAAAEARNLITAQDAADIRAAETIVLPPVTIETTSGK